MPAGGLPSLAFGRAVKTSAQQEATISKTFVKILINKKKTHEKIKKVFYIQMINRWYR